MARSTPAKTPAKSRPLDKKSLLPVNLLERVFEGTLWRSRFVTLSAVIFGVVGGLLLFLVASIDIIKAVGITLEYYTGADKIANFHGELLALIIGAVDFYLIGIVLLIFGFGIYELFVSEVDEATDSHVYNALRISSLDELKSKIIKVVIIVLVVFFFEKALEMKFTAPLDLLLLAVGIFLLALTTYFLHKHD